MNKSILKKQILYRSQHRGMKEMDLLLGRFVNKYIDSFTDIELQELIIILNIDDEILYKWYLDKKDKGEFLKGNVAKKLKQFKLK
tara:strand:- start:50 stop:304 length:255 start_codon:yes stop_codon:yes gene_type:complete